MFINWTTGDHEKAQKKTFTHWINSCLQNVSLLYTPSLISLFFMTQLCIMSCVGYAKSDWLVRGSQGWSSIVCAHWGTDWRESGRWYNYTHTKIEGISWNLVNFSLFLPLELWKGEHLTSQDAECSECTGLPHHQKKGKINFLLCCYRGQVIS